MSRNRNEARARHEAEVMAWEAQRRERITEVWQVPDYAAEAFVNLSDAIGEDGAAKVAEFVQAMLAKGNSE